MLTGSSLRRVVNIIGHEHGTRTKELAKAIRRLGYDCDDRLRRTRDLDGSLEKVSKALVKLKFENRRNWHWLAWIDGTVYDPSFTQPESNFSRLRNYLARPTSYLEVRAGTGWSPLWVPWEG